MLTDDVLMGIKREDAESPRQIKLRLPIEQVMKLHRLRILRSEPISKFVSDALEQYFEEQRRMRQVESEIRVRA